jgi:hypothetical protein
MEFLIVIPFVLGALYHAANIIKLIRDTKKELEK